MTRTLGMGFFLLAGIVLLLAITNFTGQFSAAGEVAEHDSEYGLSTTTTDLRLAMGIQFLVQILVTGLLAVVGWFLFSSETEQIGYLIAAGVLLTAMGVIRLTPVLPMSMARLSAGTAFYGTQVALEVSADDTAYYVTLPQNASYRIGRVAPDQPEGKAHVLLDFRGDQSLLGTYLKSASPVTVIGSVSGTRTLARDREVFMVPRVKVYRVGG